jgi:hypothetical protein
MMEIRFDTSELPRLEAMPKKLHWALARAVWTVAEKGAVDMKQELARQRISARSTLIDSVKADKVDDLTWTLGPHVSYARAVFEGRKPGGRMPPWQAIQQWAKDRQIGSDGGTAWAIARAIQRRGIRGRDYVTPVVDRARARLADLGAAAVIEATG